MKVYTVAVIGCGSRGFCYGDHMSERPDRFKIIAACDTDEKKLERAKKTWELSEDSLFSTEEEFFQKKRADILVIATQDRDHVRMCVRALELGYDVLLEKPISPIRAELEELLAAHKKYGGKVVVCHVLRYAPAYLKIKEFLDEGLIGKLVRIESIEQVSWWHQAHSFVRGNWRNDEQTSPMIMQKCCHDLDLLQYYVGAPCDTVYSVGDLKFFKRENQPEGAADRCAECNLLSTCPYSAENLYIKQWKEIGSPAFGWPFNVVDATNPNTEQSLRAAYENGPYGRCVFACDNNVVDNQAVIMRFKNGVDATLTMTAFTGKNGRRMNFHGTLGEIELIESLDELNVYVYGEKDMRYKISQFLPKGNDEFAHGGGDVKLIDAFYDIIANGAKAGTSLESSVESHLIALAAEKSRKTGKVVCVHAES